MNTAAKLSSLLFPVCILPALASFGSGQAPPQPALAEIQTVGRLDADSIVREIEDPSSGARWVLLRNSGHPGGPGQLVQITAQTTAQTTDLITVLTNDQAGSKTGFTAREVPASSSYISIIRAGDTLVLEEHTDVADTRLEAIALGPARLGAALRARLKLGGRIVHAIATGPGRATFAPNTEAWQ